MKVINLKTLKKIEFIDITPQVREVLASSGIKNGICLVYIPHTTAGVTINENAGPTVRADILMTLKNYAPDTLAYSHVEGNSPAHIKASIIGSSVNVIVEDGHLILGTWQGIFFCEFDGPRNRKIYIKISPV